MNELKLIVMLAKAYNKLNYKEIENVVSEDVVYESQNVLSALNGKTEVLEYLKGKFETIRKSGNLVFAEIGFLGKQEILNVNNLSEYKGRPCIILSQGNKEAKGALILVESDVNEIKRIDICTVAPHWTHATRTNKYPG